MKKRRVVLLAMPFLFAYGMPAVASAQPDISASAPKCAPAVESPRDGSTVRLAYATANAASAQPEDPAAHANLTHCSFSIPAMPLSEAIPAFSRQTVVDGHLMEYAFPGNTRAQAFITKPLEGEYGVAEAIQRLLDGSEFVATFKLPHRVVVTPAHEPAPAENPAAPPILEATGSQLEQVKVESKRPGREHIKPSGEMQPFASISRQEIDALGATDMDSVMNWLLPASASRNGGQATTVDLGQNQFNLRGLGVNETLVLVDDRREGTLLVGGGRGQADFLGTIPLSRVERIEILPASDAGRYGGGATAGIINIVLRDDCPGGRVAASFGNSFQADTVNHSVFVFHCMEAFNGRTKLAISAHEAEYSPLEAQDNDLLSRGREKILGNNPLFFMGGVIPPAGRQTNVHSADGSGLGGEGTSPLLTVPDGYTREQGLGPLLENLGRYNLELANSAQPEVGRGSVIRSGPRRQYLNGNVRQTFFDGFTGHADFTFSRIAVQDATSIALSTGLTGLLIPKNAPGNVFGQDVFVTAPARGNGRLESRVDFKRTIAGLSYQLPGDWKLDLDFAHATRKQDWSLPLGRSAAEAVIDGRLDVFSDLNANPLDLTPFSSTLSASDLISRAATFSFRAEGVLMSFGSSDIMLTGLLEHRNEKFDGVTEYMESSPAPAVAMSLLTPQDRAVNSAYVQVRLPIGARTITRTAFDEPQSVTLPLLELQAAGRFDEYVTHTTTPRVDVRSTAPLDWQTSRFQTVNPTLGLGFHPIPQLTVRSSFGTGFVPASGDQLAPPAQQLLPPGFRDPKRGYEPTVASINFRAGGNPALRPERSRSWSAGIALAPEAVRGLQASLDHVEIRKADDIVSPADLALTNFSLFEQRYPERVTRAAASQDDRYGVGSITAIDASHINVAQAKIRAWDLNVRYHFEPDWPLLQRVDLMSHVAYQPEFSIRATPSSPAENDVAVTANSPLQLGAVGGMTLTHGHTKLSWTTRYFGPYQVSQNTITLQNQGGSTVEHQTYHDLALSYERPLHRFQLDGVDLQASVQNVFARKPPFDAGSFSYFSPFGDARGAVYSVAFTLRF